MKGNLAAVLVLLAISGILVARSLEDYTSESSALIQAQDWQSLEILMRQGIREYPEREWLHANLNYSLREQKRFTEALIQAREMRKKWPNSDRSASTLSRALTGAASEFYQEGKYEQCLKLSSEAIQVDGSESSYVWTGNALRKLEKYEEAIAIQEEGLNKYPTNPWLKPNLATTYASWGQKLEDSHNFPEAIKLYQKARELAPDQEYIVFRLGRAFRSNNQYDRAIEVFSEGREKFQGSEQFSRAIGYTHLLRIRNSLKTESNSVIEDLATAALNEAKKNKTYEDAQYLVTAIGEAYTHTQNADGLRNAVNVLERVFSDPIPLWDFYGRQIYILHRRQGPVPASIKEESLSFRRKAMNAYESRHSRRPEISGLPLPLKNRFAVWAEFDGDFMTHTGFAKYCYDFSRVDENGNPLRPGGKKLQPSDYWMFGEPVYSMTRGKVVAVIDDQPDNTDGNYGRQGNSVTVESLDGTFAFYTHFKQNEVKVKEGQQVSPGTLLGLAGNSGMSTEPHLHVCIYDANWVSLPFRFKPVKIQNASGSITTAEPLKQGWIVEGH
tara:strand:- start:31589 stop:33253 length:1665 start_codon:yes stop_codon:yes gene_type:complete